MGPMTFRVKIISFVVVSGITIWGVVSDWSEAAKRKEDAIKKEVARTEWLLGTWERDYDPNSTMPTKLNFRKNNLVDYYYYHKEPRTVTYLMDEKSIHILGYLTISRNSDDIQLIARKGIIYEKNDAPD